MISAQEALQRLKDGNARFVADRSSPDTVNATHRHSLIEGQAPFAVVLGCSDSRVPVEIVFDQGFGDLFVIRVAGNIVAPSQIGSVEYAVQQLGTPLVVVLGHSRCGAVQATLDALRAPRPTTGSRNLLAIVERVRPAVEGLLENDLPAERLMQQAVRANVRAAANQLRHSSAVLEPLVQSGQLKVVGAEYALETGTVNFFDGAE